MRALWNDMESVMRVTSALGVSIALLLTASHSAAQEVGDTLGDFDRRVAAYVALHRQVERFVPPQKDFTDPSEAYAAMTALAQALRAVRPHATEGDVFSPAIATAFRSRIRQALRENHQDPSVLIDEMLANTEAGARPPAVNERFSWAIGNMMPPFLLWALPELPEELQYRFVGPILVLIDIHANLVVDVLRDALPGGTRLVAGNEPTPSLVVISTSRWSRTVATASSSPARRADEV